MKTLVVTLEEFAQTARQIAGPEADVLTAGGVLLWPEAARYDLVMVFLHPSADGRAWLDAAHQVVFTAEDVAQFWRLRGAVVFLGTCYGLENTAMHTALFQAGARAVIAGPGENYGGPAGIQSGADVLATALRAAMQTGLAAETAWSVARFYAHVAAWRGAPGAQDAVEYVWVNGGEARTPSKWGCFVGTLSLIVLLVGMLLQGFQQGSLLTFDSPISPLATDTPAVVPTFTPFWEAMAPEVAWPTPTPCITGFGCVPVTGTIGPAYYYFLPLIAQGYGWSWEPSVLRVNGVTTTLGSGVITQTDEVQMWETLRAGGQTLTFTLVENWSAGLVYSMSALNAGSVVTGTGVITWSVNNTTFGGQLQTIWDVGAGVTETITRVLTLYADAMITPTVMTRTEVLTRP
jgi:hypothetical protein